MPSPTQTPTRPTRFTQELELVSLLPHPGFLAYLASSKILADPAFVHYLAYLRYWAAAPYVRYLPYPGPSLKVLALLQEEGFRRDVVRPEVLAQWAESLMEGAVGVGARDGGLAPDGEVAP